MLLSLRLRKHKSNVYFICFYYSTSKEW